MSYADRVREIGFYVACGPGARLPFKINTGSFGALHRLTKGRPLLPRLKVLQCQLGGKRDSNDNVDLLLQLLASPVLCTLILRHPHHGVSWGEPVFIDKKGAPSDITTIVARSRSLQHFVADLDIDSEALFPLAELSSLRTIRITHRLMGTALLDRFATLPHLELLQVNLGAYPGHDEVAQGVEGAPNGTIFPSLRELTIRNSTSRAAGRVLAAIASAGSSSTIASISIRLGRSESSDDEIIGSMHHFAPRPSSTPSRRSTYITKMLKPLLSLANFEDLVLTFSGRCFSLSDADVARFAPAWPAIRRLRVTHDGNIHPSPDPSSPSIPPSRTSRHSAY
ncbi:uncharacterized protein BXZ73DRAFT_103865 [Epithele typhae]|uniref:uncharacterized protein n=1 Tax=Epithele typhae TaxID=378194 RepID=UPI0020074A84|nr:uncharacterized protein BXZ73DRAFT_103865 [Epithele typhae]KAH9923427.1 hypothetical protein BXZ73DRAFT_103865 [Epithele typhae]